MRRFAFLSFLLLLTACNVTTPSPTQEEEVSSVKNEEKVEGTPTPDVQEPAGNPPVTQNSGSDCGRLPDNALAEAGSDPTPYYQAHPGAEEVVRCMNDALLGCTSANVRLAPTAVFSITGGASANECELKLISDNKGVRCSFTKEQIAGANAQDAAQGRKQETAMKMSAMLSFMIAQQYAPGTSSGPCTFFVADSSRE